MRATGSNRSGPPSGASSTSRSSAISRSLGTGFAPVMQTQVAQIDGQRQGLTKDEYRIAAMNGVDDQHQATRQAEIPEGHRHDNALGLLARPPLNDEAHHEQRLAAETDAHPDQIFPGITEHQWYSSPMASRTSRIVSRASSRAFSQPSAMMFLTSVGSSRYIWARSRIGTCSFRMPSMTGCLHSMQPIPAVLQPCCTHSLQSSLEYTWCNCHTGQRAGSPGSVRRTRCVSVGMLLTFLATDSSDSRIVIVLL